MEHQAATRIDWRLVADGTNIQDTRGWGELVPTPCETRWVEQPWRIDKLGEIEPLSTVQVNVREQFVSADRIPHMYMRNILVTRRCAVCSVFAGNFCWLYQVIHKAIDCARHVEKKSIKVALWPCWTQLPFKNVLKVFEFSYVVFFWRTHCQDAEKKIRTQRVTEACTLVMRDAEDDVVTQFSDSKDERHDVQI